MNALPKVGLGAIGCSRISLKGILPAVASSEQVNLIMVGSRDPEKAKEVAGRFGSVGFGTYDDVLNNKEIDMVYISLPNSLHEEWAIKAANAGKHILCEKPATTSYASARKMIQAAKNKNVRLLEGYMFRYHPQNSAAKKLIQEGVLGNLMRFDGCFGYDMPHKSLIPMSKELGGGSLYVSGGYPISASRMVFDEEPESVYCKLTIDPESGIDVRNDITLNYSNGKTAFTSSIFGSYYHSMYGVLGDKAYLRMGRAYTVPRDMPTKMYLDKDDKVEEMMIEPADHFQLMLHDFCGEIKKGKESKKDYERELLNQARVVEAAMQSNEEKRVVKISEIT
ncbi:hypothetical protein A3A21_01430 [Candidatus Jorgensenbacteria bacterium RIFCSPLOWO2_01_FULL_45_25b]|uniref:Uncharacterized protein n=1 Tax=Candidatus Jorgensenbacteria bacterium RIFCSPLOWO2_01_FULL_45_25b TaxID=1798471 RepID=A0A1F6BVD3_9BACT|nr:MAG: hypothetical protein A3A21_01430 [Candidatus Jorgensenbacteria bacterium RIFCSPLOWO2_01_FULL_45_25b]